MGPAEDVGIGHLLGPEPVPVHRLGHEHRPDRGLEQRLRVEPLEAHDLRVLEFDGPEAHEVALDDDVADARGAGPDAQARDVGEDSDSFRVGPVAVDEFVEDLLEFVLVRRCRELPVGLEPQPLVVDVLGGQVGVDGQLDAHLRLRFGVLPAEVRDSLPDEADVEVEADPFDVARLLTAEQVAGAADLEVLHRHLHAGAELGVRGQGGQPVVGGLGELGVGRVEEVRVGAFATAAHPAAQLVELRETIAVGMVDDERVRIGDVDAGLDDRRAHEHVVLLLPEVDDDLFEPVLVHLAVGDRDARLGDELGQVRGDGLDVADPVVDVKDLPFAHEFAADRGLDLLVLVLPDVGEHRVALFGRGRQRRHLPDPGHRHFKGARDRGRRHREDVDVRAHRLERLLVLDAEALLLVDDDQSEVLEADLAAEQSVGADDEVELALGEVGHDLLRLVLRLEAGERADGDGESRIAFGEGLEVLLDEQGRGDEHSDLLAVLDRLEGRADRDLRLPVADVAADEAVHRHGLLHVGLDLVDRRELIGGLDVVEGVLEFALPRGVGTVGVADGGLPGGVEADELPGDLLDRLAGLRLRRLPVGAAHLVQARILPADVAADLVEGVAGDVEAVTGLPALGRGVFDDEVFAGVLGRPLAGGALRHLDEPAHPVLLVDDEVPGGEVERIDLVAFAPRRQSAHVPRRGGRRPTEHVRLGEHGQPEVVEDEPAERRRRRHRHERFGHIGGVLDEARGHTGLGEHLDHALTRTLPFGEDEDPPLVVDESPDIGEDRLDIAGVALRRPGGHGEEVGTGRGELGIGGETADLPPREPDEPCALPHLVKGAERRSREVDRGLTAAGGPRPCGLEEFVRRRHEVDGAGLDAFGFGDDDLRALRQQGDERFHAVGEDRGEGLHALDGDACRDLLEHVRGRGQRGRELVRPRAHGVGEEEFAHRRGGEDERCGVGFGRDRPLVGHREFADLIDLVAEELDAQGMVGRGREDVDDAAAHGELAAAGDHVDPSVGELGETGGGRFDLDLVADGHLDRGDLAEALGQGLEERADGRDDEGELAAGLRVGEPAEDLEALPDCVRAG